MDRFIRITVSDRVIEYVILRWFTLVRRSIFHWILNGEYLMQILDKIPTSYIIVYGK